jgi:hypothetical protein
VIAEHVVQHGQQVNRPHAGVGLGPADVEPGPGEVEVAHEQLACLGRSRAGEHERGDERMPAARLASRIRVELARRIEHRDELIDTVQVHRPPPVRLQAPALPLRRVPADQLVLERQVQDPGQVLQGLVDRPRRERTEDAAFAVEQRPARGDRLPASFGFGDLGGGRRMSRR